LNSKLRIVLGAVLVIVAVMAVNTVRLASQQIEVDEIAPVTIDADAAARRLAQALRFPSVSDQFATAIDETAFDGLVEYLATAYPEAHRTLARERIGSNSFLYFWPGTDPDLEPILLMAHLDVVPVAAEEADAWSHPPFAGRIADGYVWGRGAIDDKACVVALLEATESLLADGYHPSRGVYLAFGHDEEIGGQNGARQIASLMASRGVRLEFVLDEGFFVTEGLLAGIDKPVALIGVAEKGIVSVSLTVAAPPGHSAVPPRHTAIGILASALVRLEDRPLPARIDGVAGEMLAWLAPEMPLPQRIVSSNLWMFGPLVKARMAASPTTDAAIRTSTATTMVAGGVKENVLPSHARAVVNFRIRPGDRIADVMEHIRRVVDDDRVVVEVLPGLDSEPSPVSSTDSRAFDAIHTSIRRVFSGAVVAPALVVGATDSRHFADLSDDIYRFLPIRLGPGDVARVHGVDERISVANFAEAIRFYRELVVMTTQ
jgi:carboxypeptidase PM20D1